MTNIQSIPTNESVPNSTVIDQNPNGTSTDSNDQRYTNDIAGLIVSKMSDEEKLRMLKNRWQPPDGFCFPASTPRNWKF